MGSEIPLGNNLFADFMGWNKLTKDGNWGLFNPEDYSAEELADKGRLLWTTFIQLQCDGLKEHLEAAFLRKMSL